MMKAATMSRKQKIAFKILLKDKYLYLLLLPFNHKIPVYQLLVVSKCCYHQLHTHLIIQPFHKFLLLRGICGHIIRGIAS